MVAGVEVIGLFGVFQGLHGLHAIPAHVDILHESYRRLTLDSGETTSSLASRERIRLGVVRERVCLEGL